MRIRLQTDPGRVKANIQRRRMQSGAGAIRTAAIIALLLFPPQLALGLLAPPPAMETVVEEWLEFTLGPDFSVPGAIVHIATPYWEGTWTAGTSDLETGRSVSATD